MIGNILLVTLPGFATGAAIMALANRRVSATVGRARWLKFAVFLVIVHVVLTVAALGRAWVFGFVLFILAVGAREVRHARSAVTPPRPLRMWPLFIAVAAVALAVSWRLPPDAFAFLFLVTAGCDGFSQVVGQAVGRHQLAPRLSPGKTVEGLMGGLAAAAIIATLVRDLLPAGPAPVAVVGIATGAAGLGGDLAASWLKRRAGLKDFSSVLPGQGGFLDRFDSLLGALVLVGPVLLTRA